VTVFRNRQINESLSEANRSLYQNPIKALLFTLDSPHLQPVRGRLRLQLQLDQ
jgi:hypothetical protein